MGIAPATDASKPKKTSFSFANSNNSVPLSANSALLAVMMCILFSMAFFIRGYVSSTSPISSTKISTLPGLANSITSVVTLIFFG